jgi:hypothetical protein
MKKSDKGVQYNICPGCGIKNYNKSFGGYCTCLCKCKAENIHMHCLGCNTDFYPSRKNQIYCSRKCMNDVLSELYKLKIGRRVSIKLYGKNRSVVLNYPIDFSVEDFGILMEQLQGERDTMVKYVKRNIKNE